VVPPAAALKFWLVPRSCLGTILVCKGGTKLLNRRKFIALAPVTLGVTQVALAGKLQAQVVNQLAAEPPAVRVALAAGDFIGTLTPEQRERVLYGTDDPAVREWIYFPSRSDRNGIAFGDLSEEQRAAAFRVVAAVLSERGYQQFRGILAAEDALGIRNGTSHVNSGRYFIAFFGTPSAMKRFTVQINGHHLAIHTTYERGRVSPAPMFTGTDPVQVELEGTTVEPMQAKTAAFTGLLGGLTQDQQARAQIGAIDDVRVGTGSSNQYPEQAGMLVTDLSLDQQERVADVVKAWVGDTTDEVAERLLQEYRAQFDSTRFCWAGTTDPYTRGAYLRLDGPRLWIEFSNVGRFGNGDNHFHSIYRDKIADYLG
jgi:hypothetical protein